MAFKLISTFVFAASAISLDRSSLDLPPMDRTVTTTPPHSEKESRYSDFLAQPPQLRSVALMQLESAPLSFKFRSDIDRSVSAVAPHTALEAKASDFLVQKK